MYYTEEESNKIFAEPDVAVVYAKKIQQTNGYHFYTVSPGVNYAGICYNKECVAGCNKERVAMNAGINGTFTPSTDNAFCPGCKQSFKIEEVACLQCKFTAIVKENGNDKKYERTATKNHYWGYESSEIVSVVCEPLTNIN